MDTSARKPWHSVWFWLALGTVAALVGFMIFSPAFKGWVEEVTNWAERIMRAHPVGGGAVFFALTALSAMLTFASGIVLIPPASEVFGKPITFFLLWGGWMVGAVAAYAIGYFARPLLVRLVRKEKLEEYQKLASKHMKFWQVLLLCLAAQSEISGYLFGGLRYTFWKFLAAIAIVEAIFALGMIIAGESLMEAKPGVLVATVGTLLAVALGARILLRSRKKRRA